MLTVLILLAIAYCFHRRNKPLDVSSNAPPLQSYPDFANSWYGKQLKKEQEEMLQWRLERARRRFRIFLICLAVIIVFAYIGKWAEEADMRELRRTTGTHQKR